MDRQLKITIDLVRAPLAVIEIDTARIVDVNDGCIRLLKSSTKSDLVGKSMSGLLGMDPDAFVGQTALEIDVAFRVPPEHTTEMYMHVMVRPIPNTPFLLLEMRNDTEATRAHQRIDGIVETSFDGLWDWHLQEDYEYMSPKFWEMFGYDPKEKRHHPSEWYKLIHPADKQLALQLLDEHVKTRGEAPYYLEARYRHKDGSTVHVLCKGRVISWGPNGEALRMVGTHTDITEFVKTKLLAAEAKAEKKLNEYIAHEVRSPLFVAVSAIGFARETVGNCPDEPIKKNLLPDIIAVEGSLSYIQELVSSSLDLEKCLAGQLVLNKSTVDIEMDLLGPVQRILSLRTSHVRITVHCEEKIQCMIDLVRTKQVVMNLASNAVKFTHKGYIRLGASVQLHSGIVRIYIEDTGPGIPKEKYKRLFQRWTDLKSEAQGNGMGLHLCKVLVELMGGKIDIDPQYMPDSPFQTGSRFCVTLPFHVDEQGGKRLKRDLEETEARFDSKQQLRVIVVDDEALNRKVLVRRLLRIFPHWIFDTAVNGEEFLEKTEKVDYSIAFLDNYMYSSGGVLTGVETTRIFRERQQRRKCRTIVVGVSGNMLREDFYQAGADVFWDKPIPNDPEVKGSLIKFL